MTDESYTFKQTVRERRGMANGARHRVNGSRSRKVTMPSDYLTAAQKRRMNSAVETYTMNSPHTIKQLRTWPRDLQAQYMENLISSMNPTNKDLAYVLGVSVSAVCAYKRSLGLTDASRSRTQTCDQVRDWKKFLRDELTKSPDIIPEVPAPVNDEVPLVADDEPDLIVDGKPVTYKEITVSFTGNVRDLVRLIVTGPVTLSVDDTYEFTITCKRKEVD